MRNTKQNLVLTIGLVTLLSATSCHRKSVETANEAGPGSESAAELIQDSDRFYAGRSDLMKDREALVSLRQAQLVDPVNYDVAWRLAKYDYYLGSHSSDDTEKEKSFREGIEAGKLAVKVGDAKPDGHFWLGANYGGNAEMSTLAGLTELDHIKNEMEAVIRLDEKYQNASAYMVLGQIYLQAPALLGGDRDKAVAYLEKGVRLGPTNALLRVRLAEAYLAVNRKADARKQIDEVLAMKADPDYLPEYNEAVERARKLQDKLK